MSAELKPLREHPLAGVPTVALLGRRMDISELPWFYRAILRWVNRRVGWAPTKGDPEGSPQIQMIATDEALGRAHMKPGWWMLKNIPVNVPFPDETCHLSDGELEYFDSPMNAHYAQVPCDTVSIKICDLEKLHTEMERAEMHACIQR